MISNLTPGGPPLRKVIEKMVKPFSNRITLDTVLLLSFLRDDLVEWSCKSCSEQNKNDTNPGEATAAAKQYKVVVNKKRYVSNFPSGPISSLKLIHLEKLHFGFFFDR